MQRGLPAQRAKSLGATVTSVTACNYRRHRDACYQCRPPRRLLTPRAAIIIASQQQARVIYQLPRWRFTNCGNNRAGGWEAVNQVESKIKRRERPLTSSRQRTLKERSSSSESDNGASFRRAHARLGGAMDGRQGVQRGGGNKTMDSSAGPWLCGCLCVRREGGGGGRSGLITRQVLCVCQASRAACAPPGGLWRLRRSPGRRRAACWATRWRVRRCEGGMGGGGEQRAGGDRRAARPRGRALKKRPAREVGGRVKSKMERNGDSQKKKNLEG